MSTLLCFGFGYSARHYAARYGGAYRRLIATARNPAAACVPAGLDIDLCAFDGVEGSDRLAAAIAEADAILISVPPIGNRDPVLAVFSSTLARAPRRAAIAYLSTVGVYGDHGGGIVDETTPPQPTSERSRARLAAETAWQRLGRDTGQAVSVLRLAGIYGPGRNALIQIATGRARAILKPGQVFNRIHVDDIARSIDAAFGHRTNAVVNVADDEPSPPQEVLRFAAALLGRPPPPAIAFDEAAASLSPLGRSFYAQNKRVANGKLKAELAVRLQFPTYREGLRALFEAGEGCPSD